MLGGRLTQRKNIRSPKRYRDRRTDISGFGIKFDDGSGGGDFILLTGAGNDGDNLKLAESRTVAINTEEPITG